MTRGLDFRRGAKRKAAAGEKEKRPRFFALRPKKKLRKNFRTRFAFFARPATALIIVFYLFAIAALSFTISKTLRATAGDDLATVDFYANVVQVSENSGSGAGWSEINKALGPAEVSETGAADFFTANNSAIYAGGSQSLVALNFTTKEFIQTSASEISASTTAPTETIPPPAAADQNNSSSSNPVENSGSQGTTTAPEIPAVAAPAAETPVSPELANPALPADSPAADNTPASSDQSAPAGSALTQPAPAGQAHFPVAADVDSEPPPTPPSPGGGITAPAESPQATPSSGEGITAPAEPPPAPPLEGEGSGAPVSLFDDLKKIAALTGNWLGRTAKAQSLFGSAADDRNILFGDFKSAKIKISLAAVRQAVSAAGQSSPPADSAATTSLVEPPPTTTPSPSFGRRGDPSQGGGISAPVELSSTLPLSGGENAAVPTQAPPALPSEEGGISAAAGPASSSPEDSAKIIIWYSFAAEGNGNSWHELALIGAQDFSNSANGGYLTFDAPFLNDWRDLDDLRLKFEGRSAGGDFKFYLDSVWVQIAYQAGRAQVEEKKPDAQADKDILQVDGREIHFGYTDNNDNENLIIKTDRQKYFGLTDATVYFSVENAGVRDEAVNFQYYFPDNVGALAKIEKLDPNSPYLLETPKLEAQIYDCANGWDKRDNLWTCYPTGEERVCNLVSPNRRYCRVEGVEVGTESVIKYQNRWEELVLKDNLILPQKGFFQRLLGLGAQNKPLPENFQVSKSTADSAVIAPGEVRYFKATINFPPNTEGEFYIEAVGANDGYGLLDPWWNSGWNYRLPITINNSGNASPLSQQPVYLEISSSTSRDFWRNIRSDGGDIRFTNSSETVELPYWIQYFNYAASSTRIWVQVDAVAAATSSNIFMYYGKGTATTTSSQYPPFTYSSLQNLFYTASSSANGTIKVISLIDNNQVQLDSQTAVNLNRRDITTFTGFASTSVIKAKGPIMAKLSNKRAAESAIPVSFAAASFVIPSGRNVEAFRVYAPYANATTTIYDGTSLVQTKLISQNNAWGYSYNIATDSIAIVEATKPVLLSFTDSNSEAGDSLIGYPATTRDLYGVKSQFNLIGASAVSSFSIYCSSIASTSVSALPRGTLQTNQACAGAAQGQGDAVRLAGASGAINAIAQNDGDGNESTMFWPFKEFSTEYMLPTTAAHLAIVCAPESGLVKLSVYDSSNVFAASTTCQGSGKYPGKAYLGAADAPTYTAGSRIISTNGQPFYAYYEDTAALGAAGGDETNLFGAVQARKSSYPEPTYSYGVQQIQGPPTGAINSAQEKNDRSGRVNVSITVADVSYDNSRAKLEYVAQSGGRCVFSSPLAPSLEETAGTVSATYGTPVVQSKNAYQIGTSTGWIITSSGANTISFNWLSKTNLPSGDGTYCLRLTANDNISDQAAPATTTVTIDNAAPTAPGSLSLSGRTGSSITLRLGATSTDSHFKEYKIYYKLYDGAPVTEAGTLFSSSSDANLGAANFNKVATTTISGLTAGLKYTFNIWAYDQYGNRASSTAGVDIIADDAPTASFNSAAEKTDGSGRVDISFTADDANDDNTLRAKLEYQAGSACDFSAASPAAIDLSNITATYGAVGADNGETYRLGTTSNFILTSPGANTVNFGWLSKNDLPLATSTYCLRLTLNDGVADQATPAKIVVVVDNVKPTAPGDLSKASTTQTSIKLSLPTKFARDTAEPAANAYKLFYKAGTSGVRQTDSEFDSQIFDAYNFKGSSTVTVTGLTASTSYVFNLWAYDTFGNLASATEVTIKTDSSLTNKSLVFANPQSGSSTIANLAVADGASLWDFRAQVSDVGGYASITDVTLRLADSPDHVSPFDDLKFKWTRAGNSFAEIGADANSAAAISGSSASSCAGNSCTLDFQIVFSKTFATTTVNYAGELYSTDSKSHSASDSYSNIFQIRKTWLDQKHYRWRNDNGGG